MKKETNSKNNGFELDDFWGFSDSGVQNKKGSVGDDWSFDDLFAAKEEKEVEKQEEARLAQERAAAREATRRQIEAEFAAKKRAEAQAAAAKAEEERLKVEEDEKERVRRQAEEKAKMSQSRRKPIRVENTGEQPDPEEFSDTSTISMNRLKPEIHLTAVEPLIEEVGGTNTSEYEAAEFEYDEEYEDGEYDDEYEYEDGEYDDEYEYEDGEYDDEYEYEDGEYDDEYEYEDDEYEDEYDYEAEEETVTPANAYTPLKKENTQTAANGPKKQYGTDEDWRVLAGDDEEDEEEDEEERSKKPLIIGIICGILVLILVAVIVWAYNRGEDKEPVDQSSVIMMQQKSVSGVVTGIDANNQTVLIYDANSKKEVSLSAKQAPAVLNGVAVGDVVDVSYETGTANTITKLNHSQNVTVLKDVTNALPNGSIISIDGHTYYIDDKLVCLYQGQAFDVKAISKNTVYTAKALDDHIYTIEVTYATGSLKLENLGEYTNATLILNPINGDSIEMVISSNMDPIDIQEGSVEIQIKNDKETLYTGKVFISAGKENTLKLPSVKDKKGKVVFDSNVEEEMTILVNGQEYKGVDEVELAYGKYTGIFTAPGYEEVELEFEISQPYQQVQVEFEESTTLVTISASLWGVSLYVDGVYQGELEGDSIAVRLAPGGHSITCTRTGYQDQHQSIMILDGMDDQMLYFSGFVAIQNQESSTTTGESSTTTEESSTTTEESSSTTEESSTSTEESGGSTEDSGAGTEESTGGESSAE